MHHEFDKLVMDRLNGTNPNLHGVHAQELLAFACREAYVHIRGRAPDVRMTDVLAGESRSASFVSAALLLALEHCGKPIDPMLLR